MAEENRTTVVRAIVIIMALIAAVMFPACGYTQHSDARSRFAIIIGIERYPNLSQYDQLAGAKNDAALMRRLLVERFAFEDKNIVTLINDAATGNAIRAELGRLVDRVKSTASIQRPAHVVFHFSGHGSQLPDQPVGDTNCDEPDGLDETLVPFDATKQGGPEDFRDDELDDFLIRLCDDGRARAWCILDCCHAGTGARGLTRFRSLERGSALPLEPSDLTGRLFSPKRLPMGAVLLAACRAHEKEPEFIEGSQHYGLLTRFLVQVLNSEPAVSRLSFGSLAESIAMQYRRAGITSAPTPQIEGRQQHIVMDADASLDRKAIWPVAFDAADRSTATINAGALHGITIGSLFEIYERPEQIVENVEIGDAVIHHGPSIGWLRIADQNGLTSTGRLFKPAEGQTPPAEGFAIERYHKPSDFRLRVRVVNAIDDRTDGPPSTIENTQIPERVRAAFANGGRRKEQGQSPWLYWSTEDEPGDVLIRLAGDYAAVFPVIGRTSLSEMELSSRSGVPRSLIGGWGPIDVRSPTATEDLLDILGQIQRVRGLYRIAAMEAPASAPRIKLNLMTVEIDENNRIKGTPVSWPSTQHDGRDKSLVMRSGEYYAFQLTNLEPNATGQPAFVTVLRIDANMRIDAAFPFQADAIEEQKVPPGESRLGGPYHCNGPKEAPVYGKRWAVALATRRPNNLHLLERAGLPVARSAALSAEWPLNSLLLEQIYFRSRGLSEESPKPALQDGSWSACTIEWFVETR